MVATSSVTVGHLISFGAFILTLTIALVGAAWTLGNRLGTAGTKATEAASVTHDHDKDYAPIKHEHNGTYVRTKECELCRQGCGFKLDALTQSHESLIEGQKIIFERIEDINKYLRSSERSTERRPS